MGRLRSRAPRRPLLLPAAGRRYRAWREEIETSMRQVHAAGEKMFSGFAGDTLRIVDPESGEVKEAHLFVAAMGFSSNTCAETFPSEHPVCWVARKVDAISYFGVSPHIIVPDNPKALVTRADRYEPELNRTFEEMAAHYGAVVIPARAGKPRDKAKVESAVLQAERWILAPLRNGVFFSLAEANLAISERLCFLNDRIMRGMGASPKELFGQMDRETMLTLPDSPYEFATFKKARLNIDYHIEAEKR